MDKQKKIYEKASLIRALEESLLDLFSQGKLVGTVHTCIGQELIGPSICEFLEKDDFVFSNHRGHGHYISRTNDCHGLIAEVMGRSTGSAGGIGGSQHLYNENYFSNGIQGGTVPISAGSALAFKLRKEKSISVSFIGDGTWGEGIVYETLNISSLWEIPCLLIVENNNISQSTSSKQNKAGSIQKRTESFEVKYFSSNTQDLKDLLLKAGDAVKYVRENCKPAVIEIFTDRLKSHSKGDDNRDPSIVNKLYEKDLLTKFIKTQDGKALHVKHKKEIAEHIKKIESKTDSYSKTDINKEKLLNIEQYSFSENSRRINEDIYNGLLSTFKDCSESVIIGEDIEDSNKFYPGSYGGAFKVTRDLSTIFKERVKNTPISEAAIVGIGNGLALNKMKPIVEIMFGDFLTLAFDQILNHSTKFVEMFGRKLSLPILIRVPMGAKRGYGPTHSQTLENHFLGIRNLDIFAINSRINNDEFVKKLANDIKKPTLLIENKVLYTKKNNRKLINGFEYLQANFKSHSELIIKPKDDMPSDLAIICYGELLDDIELVAEELFLNEEILSTIICLTKISEPNIDQYFNFIKDIKNIYVIEEGSDLGGFSSEIISILAENNQIRNKNISRLGNRNLIPCSKELERQVVPNNELIYKFIMEKYGKN